MVYHKMMMSLLIVMISSDIPGACSMPHAVSFTSS